MGVTVDVVRVACNTSTGNQNITGSLGGLTPKAALFILTKASADGTAAADAWFSYGAATGASNRWVISFADTDNVGTTEVYSNYYVSTYCIALYNGGGTLQASADFSSFSANTVTVNWDNAPGTGYLLTVVMFAGSDLSAHANYFNIVNTLDNTVDVTDPGFEPDVLFVAAPMGAVGAHHETSLGICHNDGAGTITQRCVAWNSQNGQSTAKTSIANRNDSVAVEGLAVNITGWDWWLALDSFDASGFSAHARNNPGNNRDILYLALNFNGAVSSGVITHTTPTSTGSNSETGFGFKPQFAFIIGTEMTTANAYASSGDEAGARLLSAITSSAQYSNSPNAEDGPATTNTQSLSDNVAIELPDADGTAGITASFTSFDTNGWTLNYSAVKGTGTLFWALGIEEESAGGTDNLTANDTTLNAIVGDIPSLGQIHVLGANGSDLSPLVGDAPALSQVHALSANDSNLSGAVGDAPALGQAHSLSASDSTLAGVIGDTPLLSTSGVDNLSANDATLSAILGDTPALSQTHVLSAVSTNLSGMLGDSLALGQVHILSVTDATLDALIGDTPILSITGMDNLSASDVLLDTIVGDKPVLTSTEEPFHMADLYRKFIENYTGAW